MVAFDGPQGWLRRATAGLDPARCEAVRICAGARSTPRQAPLVVRWTDLERYAPPGRSTADLRAWLLAPLAGAPLLRRLLEPLLGLPVARLALQDDRAGRAVAELLADEAWFGWGTGDEIDAGHPEPAAPRHLDLPADGLAEFDLGAWFRTAGDAPAEALLAPRTGWPRRVTLGALPAADRAAPEHVDGLFHPCAEPAELLATAAAALAGRIPSLAPHGRTHGDLLLGARTRISARTFVRGRAAVGDATRIERDVTLGPSASIGRRCVIGRGAWLEDCVVLDDAFVLPGEVVKGVVRGPGSVVG